MAKRNFMQTPEQRERANYYSKKRRQQVSGLPLIQEQMVEEQFIETPEVVEQEPVFEYATPSMPSSQEVAATFDTGTAGMWSDVVDNITGSIMGVTQDVFEFNAKRKIEKRKLTLDKYSADTAEYDAVAKKIDDAFTIRLEGGNAEIINIPEAIKREKINGMLELSKKIYIQNNGSEELQSSIQEELSARGIEDSFDSLSGQQQLDIMETIFIQSDSLLFGEAIRQDREQQWLDIMAAVEGKDYGKMTENLTKYRDKLNQAVLSQKGLADQEFANDALNNSLSSTNLDLAVVDTAMGGNFDVLENLVTSNGVQAFNIQRNDQGEVVSIGFNGSPEQFMADEQTRNIASLVFAQQLRSQFPSNSIENIPERISLGLKALAAGDTDEPFAITSLLFLSDFDDESIEGLVSRGDKIGGLGINNTDQNRLMTMLTLHKYLGSDEPGKNRDTQRTLNEFDRIWDSKSFNSAYTSLASASDEKGIVSKRQEIIKSFLGRMGIEDEEYDPLAYNFEVGDNPSLGSLMVLLYQINQRTNLSEEQKTNISNAIYNNARAVPIFREIDGERKLVDLQLRNSTDHAIFQMGIKSFDDRVFYEDAAGQSERNDIEDVNIILNNLAPETRRGFDIDELEEATIQALEETKKREMNELDRQRKPVLDPARYRLSTLNYNETVFLMTPSVQQELFDNFPEGSGLVEPNSIENLLANFDMLSVGQRISNIEYSPSTNLSRQERNNANYGSSSFGYGIKSIEFNGEVINVEDSFASRNRTGMVFPSVYSDMYTEDGEVKAGNLPPRPVGRSIAFWKYVTGQTGTMRGAGVDELTTEDVSEKDMRETKILADDPKNYQDILFYQQSPGWFESSVYEWYNWLDEKYEQSEIVYEKAAPIIMETVNQYLSQAETGARVLADVSPEPIRNAIDQTLDNLPDQFSQVEKAITEDLVIAAINSIDEVIEAPGMVADAALREAPKLLSLPNQIVDAVKKSYLQTIRWLGRSSEEQHIDLMMEEASRSSELREHLTSGDRVQDSLAEPDSLKESLNNLGNSTLDFLEDSEDRKQKNRTEQREFNKFNYYVSEKLKENRMSLKDKKAIMEMVPTKAQFIVLYNKVKNNQETEPTFLDLYESLLETRSLTLMENN